MDRKAQNRQVMIPFAASQESVPISCRRRMGLAAGFLALSTGLALAQQDSFALRAGFEQSPLERRTTVNVIEDEDGRSGTISDTESFSGNPPASQSIPRPAARAERERLLVTAEERRLPQAEPETTATIAPRQNDPETFSHVNAAEAANTRAEAAGFYDHRLEEAPYAPLGIRAGTFVIRPSLEQGLAYSSNPNFTTAGSSAVLSQTTLRLQADSDWTGHAARLDAYGAYRKSLSGVEVEEPELGIDGSLRLDLADGWNASGAASYRLRRESASSPVEIVGVASRPLRQTLTASLEATRTLGAFRLGAEAVVERDWYGDAELSGGGSLSQKDRNNTLLAGRLRTGYAVSPALIPFVETEIGRRIYDNPADAAGYDRSADRLAVRAGSAFDLGEKFNGELAIGWLRESLDDPRLAPISALSVEADVNWSPERGTLLNLSAGTTVEGTTTANESGSVLYFARLAASRQIRADLTGTTALGGYWRDYAASDGKDVGLYAEASLTWWLNRYLGLIARARHERQRSNLPGRDADVTSIFGGFRLQR
jgi:hypothetical protein